jgi:tetratricopeptide (TPR) repeat protein
LDALKQATNAQAAALASSAESRRQREKLEDLMGFLLDDLSDKLRLLGRVDLLARVTERVLDHYRSLPPDDSSDDSLGRRFAAFKNRGLVLAARGDGAGALAAYRTGADLAQQLSARQPTNRTWLGEQALCAQRIGELWESRGNSTKALAQFEQSRQLAQHLSAQAPAESQWRACLVASELKIGDVLRTQTETAQALDAYQRALALARRLAETSPNDDPDGVAWRHVLTVSFSKTGAAFLEEGRPDDAREACQKSLNLARQLVAERPGTPQWQTDLAAALDSLGDVLLATHDIRPARQHYEESAHLRMRLALTDPANSQWQRDLMLSYARLGRVLSQQSKQPKVAEFIGDSHRATMSFVQQPLQLTRRLFASDQRSQAALAEIERSVETARQLAKRDPDNAQWQENLASSCSLLGDLCFQIGNHPKALQNYQEAIAIRQRLVEHDPFAGSLQHRLAAAHASATAALWRLAQRPAALVQARSALDSLAALASRWPGNLALREGVPPEAGPRGSRWLTADQLNAVREAIVWGFASAREQAAHQAADPAGLEEWARYCQEMAVCRLLLGEPAASVAHAQNAVSAWQRLNLITPTNTLTASALGPAWISLSAYQLLNGQAHAAAQSATRAFEIQPLDIAAKAMLAIACFCDSRYEEGSRILRDNKDHPARHSQTFAQAVREDLRQLQAKRFRQLDLEQIKRVVDTNAPQPTDR